MGRDVERIWEELGEMKNMIKCIIWKKFLYNLQGEKKAFFFFISCLPTQDTLILLPDVEVVVTDGIASALLCLLVKLAYLQHFCLYYGMSFFVWQLILYCTAIPSAYTLTCWWTVGFVPPLSFCKTNAAVHTGVPGFSSSESTFRVVTLGSCVHLYLASWDNAKLYSTAATPFHIPSSKAWAFQFSISTNMDI